MFYAKGGAPRPLPDEGPGVRVEWVHADDGTRLSETFAPFAGIPDGYEVEPGQVTQLRGAVWRVERTEPASAAQWRASGRLVVWIRRAVPRTGFREFSYGDGLARLRLPDSWRASTQSNGDVVFADPAGTAQVRLTVKLTADLRPLEPGEDERHRRTLPNGCVYRYTDQEYPHTGTLGRRVRRWDVAQPLGDGVRSYTFSYAYEDKGWGTDPTLDLLFQEIPQMVPGPQPMIGR
jgi:hypothetical protein